MSDTSFPRLTGEQVMALRFAAHRQLARWSNNPRLSPHQHAQRSALKAAVRILQVDPFTRGCELRASEDEQPTDV